MNDIKNKNIRKQHFWTYLPELGPDYSYCELCDKVIYHFDVKQTKMSYQQALEHKKGIDDANRNIH